MLPLDALMTISDCSPSTFTTALESVSLCPGTGEANAVSSLAPSGAPSCNAEHMLKTRLLDPRHLSDKSMEWWTTEWMPRGESLPHYQATTRLQFGR